jgi:anti-sigma regulatory factor (Ser/Thr protein kinase)
MIAARLDRRPIALADTVPTAQERILARRTFPGLPDQVPVARQWLARMIDGFAAADDVLLACSELTTNAIMHSDSGLPDGTFTVRLAIRQDIVRVEVLDQGGVWAGRPQLHRFEGDQAEDASQCGRGLTIVAAITDAWGISGDHEGRTTWCEIRSGP